MPLCVALILFGGISLLLLPLVGLQADEALFASPLYDNINQDLAVGSGRFSVPLMVMSYLGSLKALLYWPLLKLLPANVWTIRLPVVLLGAATLFFFYRLTSTLTGRRGAAFGVLLLAVDPLFLMTNTFDWGPVAMEHLLLVTGCWAVVCFDRSLSSQIGTQTGAERHAPGPIRHSRGLRPHWPLALGFFCFGLALWNKAIFAWALIGLVAATLSVLVPAARGSLRNWFTLNHLATATLAFCLGAAPLLLYNVTHNFATLRDNARLAPEEIPGKWVHLKGGLQGNSLFGYLAAEEWREPTKPVQGPAHRASAWLRQQLGERLNSGFYYLLGALILCIPWWWRSRTAWFALLFCAAAWMMMAATHDAGGAGHHVVLLWPFPVLFAAAVLARMPRWLAIPAVAVQLAFSLSVDNQYFYQLRTNGTARSFTDAIFPLSKAFSTRSDWRGKTIYVTDWGLYDNLNLLHKGRLTLRVATDFALPDPAPEQVAMLDRILLDESALFVGHVAGEEFFEGARAHLFERAERLGTRPQVLETIADSNGRPVIEVLQIPASAGGGSGVN